MINEDRVHGVMNEQTQRGNHSEMQGNTWGMHGQMHEGELRERTG